MSKSVEVSLLGGLGNQMFQYAVGRSLSIRLGLPLVLDVSMLRMPMPTARDYQLGCFRLSQQRIRHLPLLFFRARRKLICILESYGIASTHLIQERGLPFEPEVLRITGPCYLEGYWQSDRYFESISDHLRQDFTILPAQDARSGECQARMQRVKSIGLHIRRGDYTSNSVTNAYHGTCPQDYYDAALKLVLSRLGPHAELFVFSDDMEWARRNIRYPLPTTYVDWNAERNYEDLRLMSACRALVIANSTFSWWAGWLNSNPEKLVVAPKRWFQAPGAVSDLPGSRWLSAL